MGGSQYASKPISNYKSSPDGAKIASNRSMREPLLMALILPRQSHDHGTVGRAFTTAERSWGGDERDLLLDCWWRTEQRGYDQTSAMGLLTLQDLHAQQLLAETWVFFLAPPSAAAWLCYPSWDCSSLAVLFLWQSCRSLDLRQPDGAPFFFDTEVASWDCALRRGIAAVFWCGLCLEPSSEGQSGGWRRARGGSSSAPAAMALYL
jgi:hypothetical protein